MIFFFLRKFINVTIDTNTVTNSVTIALNFEFKTLAIFDVESFKTYVTVENLQSDVISGLLKMRKCLPI
jgi:hypothetical protein